MKDKRKKFVIAIDGPASSGKSTTAKLLAKKLKCVYIDSGAMYRAVALFLKDNNIDLENETALKEILDKINIEILYNSEKDENIILLNGKDVSMAIRNSEITNYSSIIATKKIVREKMVQFQRMLAKNQSIIMDGRDIGTVVFPDADFKFFLTASLNERAKRRFLEMKNKSAIWPTDNISLERIKEELKWRDRTDSNRKISPLKKAKDAILIDTTNLTIEEQVKEILNILKK
ncbi:MAG: (d)CMP kinase [Candidatus Cloacimonadota bacterium]|nr:(d)CMP kinase [Candidatus Cloacimonadota bacterium]